jgi:hypothetical protein
MDRVPRQLRSTADEQHAEIADMFDAEVREEACGKVPLFRRNLNLVAAED